MKSIGIIPARFASNRLPGKPLLDLEGKSLIQRVYENAIRAGSLDELVVATDHKGIYTEVKRFGGKVLMTASDHKSGTDRIAEALNILESAGQSFDIILNIQGDEPFLDPGHIDLLVQCLSPEKPIATLISPIRNAELLHDPNVVKAVISTSGFALYFSRQAIPYARDIPVEKWLDSTNYYQHLGIYGFHKPVLLELVKGEQSILEKAESLEQLRWLEMGYSIGVEIVDEPALGIDTPADLEMARQFLAGKSVK